jgi:mannose-1-phosphate guanylyltransferase
MRRRANLWAVVLAGGEGSRVAHLTTDGRGRTVPKQFWRIQDRGTMLEWTLKRARLHTDSTRIVALVTDRQRPWWERHLRPLLSENVLSQPENRGTAVALLHAVVHVLLREPWARVLVLPSDHYLADEKVLERTITRAVDIAEGSPEHLVLLGAHPERDDAEYGWILPASGGTEDSVSDSPRAVERFVEKPAAADAQLFRERGAVWNTFVLTFVGWALVHVFQRTVPDLVHAYMAAIDGGRLGVGLARQVFGELPRYDFGRDVLEKATPALKLVTLPPCGWIDLGTPERIQGWLAQADMGAP